MQNLQPSCEEDKGESVMPADDILIPKEAYEAGRDKLVIVQVMTSGSASEKERRAAAPGRHNRDRNMSRQDGGGSEAARRKAIVVEVPKAVAVAAARVAPDYRLVRVRVR